jgi:hypothetical protein
MTIDSVVGERKQSIKGAEDMKQLRKNFIGGLCKGKSGSDG